MELLLVKVVRVNEDSTVWLQSLDAVSDWSSVATIYGPDTMPIPHALGYLLRDTDNGTQVYLGDVYNQPGTTDGSGASHE